MDQTMPIPASIPLKAEPTLLISTGPATPRYSGMLCSTQLVR